MFLSSFDQNIIAKLNENIASLKELFSKSLSSLSGSASPSSSYEPKPNNFSFLSSLSSSESSFAESEALSKINRSLGSSMLLSKEFFANNRKQILSIVARLLGISVSALVSYFLFKWLMKNLDPTNADKLPAKIRAERIMKEIGLTNIELNEYELVVASNLVTPSNIDCSWQDIGGLDHIIDDLRQTIVYPLKNFESNQTKSALMNNLISKRSRLIQPPKGALLFGPPGNAKTMIAKCLARESGARFINLQVSTLFDKWFGESQKRAEAIFTLAAKVQPVIIFIDEIDSFLRNRRTDDHECTSTIKTQFMTLWDGLTTNQNTNRILIIGATNRPEDVDPAILRRMPQMFFIGLPNKVQREKILKVILKDENLSDDVDLNDIADRSADFSGSDLHELCRCAAMNCFIESIKKVDEIDEPSESNQALTPAHSQPHQLAIRKCDFDVAFQKMAVKSMTSANRFEFARLY